MSAAEPACRLLASSAALGWQGIAVERRSHDAGSWQTPALPVHLVCLYRGAPLALGQKRDVGERWDRIVDGTLQLVPAGLDNRWMHRERAGFIALQLSPDLVQRAAGDGAAPSLGSHYGLRDPVLLPLATALEQELLAGGEHGPLYAESLATALALRLLKAYSAARLPPTPAGALPPYRLRRVLERMHAQLDAPLGLEELADVAGLSASHFSACFRRSTGLPPYEYLLRLRVERARQLLGEGRLTAAEVAAVCGFCDQSHLARHCRRLLGQTPRQLLRG